MSSEDKDLVESKAKGKCIYCDYESNHNMIYKDTLTNEYYLRLEDIKEYIKYCPYCGRRLNND